MGHTGLIQFNWLEVNCYRLTEKNVNLLIKVLRAVKTLWRRYQSGACWWMVSALLLLEFLFLSSNIPWIPRREDSTVATAPSTTPTTAPPSPPASTSQSGTDQQTQPRALTANSGKWQISDLISISSAVLNVDCLIVTEWRYCWYWRDRPSSWRRETTLAGGLWARDTEISPSSYSVSSRSRSVQSTQPSDVSW